MTINSSSVFASLMTSYMSLKGLYIIIIIFVFSNFSRSRAQDVVINEIMSSNAQTIADEDGDYPDWIELYNRGISDVNLTGWTLSDDPDNPRKWTFPDVSIRRGGYLSVFASGKDRSSSVLEWETAISEGDSCRYLNVTENVTDYWSHSGFNDKQWAFGITGLGYGDGDDSTVVEPSQCIYLRQRFDLTDVSAVTKMLLHVDYDDGFVAYLNGIEVARANIGSVGVRPAYNQSASDIHEAKMYRGGEPDLFELSSFSNLLHKGENLLAIEVHNYGSLSSDLTIIPFLSLGYSKAGLTRRGPAPQLHLPVVWLHTNFKIKSSGEDIVLSDNYGQSVDRFENDKIPVDISKGRYPDGAADWYFFNQPTPNQSNSANGFKGFAPSVLSSCSSGFYENSLLLSLTTNEVGVNIYFTIDGSLPTEQTIEYQSPIIIPKTSVLRARAYKTGCLPGPVLTQTYFINETSDLPVISLTTAPDNLWDEESGMYSTGPNADSQFPYFGANFWQDWERAAHIEFFETNKSPVFSNGCGIKIYGGWSRGFPQKSLAVFFRAEYGASKLAYPVFPELDINQFEALVLRNSGNDWESTMLRDGMMGSLLSNVDVDRQAFRPAVVFINGAYWGIYNIREKINEHFIASHHHVHPDQIDMLENNQTTLYGDNENYQNLLDYIDSHEMNTDESREFLQQQIDIKEYFDYVSAQIYFNNTDWPGNNLKYWRPRTADGRWRWILFDTDFGFGLYDEKDYKNNTLEFALEEKGPDWPNPPWSTFLLRNILENDDLRAQFINYFADHLNITFKTERVLEAIKEKKNIILTEIPDHLTRWNKSLNQWKADVECLENFARNRVAYMRQYLMQYFGLSGTGLVDIQITGSTMGKIKINNHLVARDCFSGYYFPEIPVKVKALPNPGYRFLKWDGAYSSTEKEITFYPYGHTTLTAHFEKTESSENSVVINEINYNSHDTYDSGDWVEIYNASDEDLNCGGWIFKDENDNHCFVFPENTVLAADSFLVLISDLAKFTTLFPHVTNYIGITSFGLSGSGELIRLFNSHGDLIDSLTYDDKPPWPEEADGKGATLELINPLKDNTKPENWAASYNHGSPGEKNSAYTDIGEVPFIFPQKSALEQNYPNPFNQETVIGYRLLVVSDVEITVYDVLGQKIQTLVNAQRPAGNYQVRFDGSGLASGVYYYVLKYNGQVSFKKMILLR